MSAAQDAIPTVGIDQSVPFLRWSEANVESIKGVLASQGLCLLRGMRERTVEDFERFFRLFSNELIEDAFWSSPRSSVSGRVFTSTEYRATEDISLHSEMSYMKKWPRLLAFHCVRPADEGGETTLCSLDELSRNLGDIARDFAEKRVRYVRRYRSGIDIPWQRAFRTEDRDEVAEIARRNEISLEWLPTGDLVTFQEAQGCIRNDQMNPVWFNQAHIFHPANLPRKIREHMIAVLGANLPRQAFWGDGTTIPDDVIEHIIDQLDRSTLLIPWQSGEVVIVDNMRFAHGRKRFAGPRSVHIALGLPTSELNRRPIQW